LPQVATALLSRGAVTKIVVTTGSVQPVTSVTVGSQVSGTVSWLGADFNSIVQKGQIIARSIRRSSKRRWLRRAAAS
jgi:HlyD family secretion protein